MNNSARNSFIAIKEQVVATKPLIHHITNYVTANACANVTLSFGAAPIMADAVEEVATITSHCQALVLNLGTINKAKYASMLQALRTANEIGIPSVLDPVGIMASTMRYEMARELIREGVTIIRGNASEIATILGVATTAKGVDSSEVDDLANLVRKVAVATKSVVACSGAIDYVSDGDDVLIAGNGHPMLTMVTGTGCMTTSLIASCAAVTKDYKAAAMCGITAMNIAGERAYARMKPDDGTGSFARYLLDNIYLLTGEELTAGYKGVGEDA